LLFALLLGHLGPHTHELEERLPRERALEPVQELRGRIDLIVATTEAVIDALLRAVNLTRQQHAHPVAEH
jgi:hypothetical protein